MYSQFFQRKKEKDYTTSEDIKIYFSGEGLRYSIGFPETESYLVKNLLSLYPPSYDLEIQNLKSMTNVLIDQINALSKVIQNLQNRKIIPIQNLRSTKLQLKGPFYVVSEYEDGVFVISSDDINLYGYGDTELNAIRDFCKDVEYFYFDLKQSKEKLCKIVKESWEFLKNIVIEL